MRGLGNRLVVLHVQFDDGMEQNKGASLLSSNSGRSSAFQSLFWLEIFPIMSQVSSSSPACSISSRKKFEALSSPTRYFPFLSPLSTSSVIDDVAATASCAATASRTDNDPSSFSVAVNHNLSEFFAADANKAPAREHRGAGVVHIRLIKRNQGVRAEPGGAPSPDLPLTLLSHVKIELGSDGTDRAASDCEIVGSGGGDWKRIGV